MADTLRDLLDEDGENRALRSFLMQYGSPGLTVGEMRDHMKRSGWGGEYWPFFVSASNRDAHLSKGGAQIWIRHLLGMEVASRPAEVDERLKAVHAAGAQLADAQQRRAERCERLGIAEVDDEGLPPLPEPRAIRAGHSFPKVYALAYTAEQYRQGQRDAVAADRARRGDGGIPGGHASDLIPEPQMKQIGKEFLRRTKGGHVDKLVVLRDIIQRTYSQARQKGAARNGE